MIKVGDKVWVSWGGYYPNEIGVVVSLPGKKQVEVLFEDGVEWLIPARNVVPVWKGGK